MLQRNVELPLFFRQAKSRNDTPRNDAAESNAVNRDDLEQRQSADSPVDLSSGRPVGLKRSEPGDESRSRETTSREATAKANTTVVGLPQPIKASDRKRLVKVCDPQIAPSEQSPQPPLDKLAQRDRPASPDSSYSNRTLDSASDESLVISEQDSAAPDEADAIAYNHLDQADPQPDSPLESRLEEQLRRQQQDQRLRQVERKLRSSLNLATVLGATVVETAAFFQSRQVSLLRSCPSWRCWQQVAQYCDNQSLAWQPSFCLSQDEFPHLSETLQQGHSVRLHVPAQGSEDEALGEALAEEARRWLTKWPGHWLLVPIKHRQTTGYLLNAATSTASESSLGDYWGVMVLACAEGQTWSQTAVAMSQSIAVELEWAIAQAHQHQELMQANQELQKLALSDGLTRLANRRRFDEHLFDEWQRLARDQQPLSLILCDLDHFKRYNDTFGHPAGDRCLIRVARALLNGPQRPADLVARYGGEEFAVILPNTDTHGAWRIAQKIHKNIRDLKIEHAPDNEEQYVTVTMGVSTVVPGHGSTAQMLVQASDLALYHAKQQGRNRTYVNAHYNTVEARDERSSNAPLDIAPAQ